MKDLKFKVRVLENKKDESAIGQVVTSEIDRIESEHKKYREKAEEEIKQLKEVNEQLRKKCDTNDNKAEKIAEEVGEIKNVWAQKSVKQK